MKCAMDLITISARVVAEQEEAKRMAEERRKQELRKDTLNFCEALGKKIESRAWNGYRPCVIFYTDAEYNTIESTYEDYSGGVLSYKYGTESVELDPEIIREWFSDYCFQVIEEPFTYKMYHYGTRTGRKFTIAPVPECK